MSRSAPVPQEDTSPEMVHSQTVFRKTALAQSVSAIVLTSVAGTAAAQQIEEVIVTATKRAESIQDVPLAITAFTGEFVKDVNLDDVKDLVTFTPGVTGNSHDSFIDAISIRGVRTQDFGVGGDPSAAFFKNNLYEGRNGSVISSLYDMERAEVLRGPQGFLFGRNAAGGAFSVHTKRPNLSGDRDGYVELDAGERGHFTFEGGFTSQLSENFALRIAGYHSQEDGYVENASDPGNDLIGHDKSAARLSGLYEKDQLRVFFTADFEDQERDGSVYRPAENSPQWEYWQDVIGAVELPADRRDANVDLVSGNNDDAKSTNLGLHVDYDFDKMSLSWSTGFKDHDYLYNEDYDGTPLNAQTYRQDQSGDYLQTELRLTSNTDSPLSWYAGLSYYKENIDVTFMGTTDEELICAYYGYYYDASNCSEYFAYLRDYYGTNESGDYYVPEWTPSSNGRVEERNIVNGRYNGWAAYVDLSYQINDLWDVSLGVRYTYDEKKFTTEAPRPESLLQNYYLLGYMTEPLTDKNDWSQTTPRLVVRYMPNDDTTLFASYTQGYKSGGFGTFSLEPAVYQLLGEGVPAPLLTMEEGYRPSQFRPEDVESYEIGYKGLLAGGQAQLDVTAFMYDYTDLQVNYYEDGSSRVGNAGKVDGRGVEATLQWAINENWDFVGSIGFLDTEATGVQFLCGGAPDADGFLDGDVEACEGNKLYWAPDVSGSAVLKGNFPTANGAWIGNIEVFFESERGRGYEDLDYIEIDAYQEWALRVGYQSNNNWSLTAYVENLTDELTYDGAAVNEAIIPPFFFGPSRPRTAGLRFGYSFD